MSTGTLLNADHLYPGAEGILISCWSLHQKQVTEGGGNHDEKYEDTDDDENTEDGDEGDN